MKKSSFPDPPGATSDQAACVPVLDEDYLILSTIHSAKGREWKSVYVLNVVDGCMPSDLGAGISAELKEERRLLYVAMTRAKDDLHLMVSQHFFTHGQHSQGDRHVYASRTRFIPAFGRDSVSHSGAPRPMKMGTIRSLLHYYAAARRAGRCFPPSRSLSTIPDVTDRELDRRSRPIRTA